MVLKNLFTRQQWRNRPRIDYGLGERGGEGEMHGKNNKCKTKIIKEGQQREPLCTVGGNVN